jgi:hypothetical protein
VEALQQQFSIDDDRSTEEVVVAVAFPMLEKQHDVATAIVEGRSRRCNPATVRAHGTKAATSHERRWEREKEEA